MRASRANTIFWLVWAFLFICCFFNSFDDPTSIFYSKTRAYRTSFSDIRIAEADRFIASLNATSSSNRPPEEQDRLLCIGIPSINRTTQSFLTHTLGSLVDNLTPQERGSIVIAVLLADRSPSTHFAYGKPWLSQMADEVLVYNTSKVPTDDAYHTIPFDVNGTPRGDGRVENMRLDHSVLVETCRNSGARYFALVEDDVIASRDWFYKLKHGLRFVENQTKRDGKSWLYLRLFYSELFMGWNLEELLVYMETVFFVYAAVFLIFLVLLRRRRKSETPKPTVAGQSFSIAALALGLWTPAAISLYFMAGRVTMDRLSPFPLSGVREMPRYGCCAQGLVFPAPQLEGIQNLLREPPYDFPGDMIFEGYAANKGLSKWALRPSVLQHVGFKESSAGPRRAEVWNFSFERQHKK